MKVKKLVVEEGILGIEGKRRMCPYSVGPAGNQNLCGEWCALFTLERPASDRVKVNLNCSSGTTYESY